jgi:hypothetical protein
MPPLPTIAEGRGWDSLTDYAHHLQRRFGMSLGTALGWVYDHGTAEVLMQGPRRWAANIPAARSPG